MKRWSGAWTAPLLVGWALASARGGEEGSKPPACPPTSYSPCHYWTPTLYRLYDCIHYGKHTPYIPDCHYPDAVSFKIVPFPCPPVDPITLYLRDPYGFKEK